MRISSTLPLLLLPFVLGHVDRLRSIHHPSRRIALSQRNDSEDVVKRAEGVLAGIISDDKDDRTTAVTPSTTPSLVRTSAISTAQPTSTVAVSTRPLDIDTSSLVVPVRPSTTSSAVVSVTGISSIASTGTASAIIGSNSTLTSTVSASVGTNITANATSTAASTTTSSSSSSSASDMQTSASVHYTTDAAGQTQMVTVFLTQAAASEAAATSTSSAAATSKSGGSISTGAIIGISVAVGVVVIALIAFAVWRMKRRTSDEDEAIRWPELNRHGDSSAHHALPARQTGQHGFETNPLERSLSNSSSIFAPSSLAPPHSAAPMALNGSSFGAASSLEEEYTAMSEKYPGGPPSHDDHDNYTSFPPPVEMEHSSTGGARPMYGVHDDENEDPYGGMSMANPHHVTYPHPAVTGPNTNYRIE
ncbi:hypothetical protein CI109_103590 [Kwoniella shandongensis]|uniref:Uncharacterized protein n=1 Tax=Kwoniella shandongensis TaxID=1734106 RepID=A0A5M6C7P5_9TREE|nr:uncharacterized protein CI109_000718 [Kwoniella shandongensis]KAA5531146.1 hypothetical protein CI109_000718 [Kwoniella shandongensis]